MHFCDECGNMYYISISEENPNVLQLYCRNCGHKNTSIPIGGTSVSKLTLKGSSQQFSHIINEYTTLDPTLPRVDTIPCPNETCDTIVKHEPREIIYIRYDSKNMKYVYLCSSCKTVWENK